MSELFNAIRENNIKLVEELLNKKGAKYNNLEDGTTPLYLACKIGNANMVETILKSKEIDVNKASQNSLTPLHVAVEQGHKDIVEILMKHSKIGLNAIDRDGNTPLMMAGIEGRSEIAGMMIDDDRVNLKILSKNDGFTILHIACLKGNSAIVDMLIKGKNEFDFNQPSKTGYTAFYLACLKTNADIVDALVKDTRIDPNKRNKAGFTPFYAATLPDQIVNFNVTKIFEIMLKNERVLVNESFGNTTVFYYACQEGLANHVRAMIESGRIDVNKGNATAGPINVACLQGHTEVVKELIKDKNVDLTKADKDGVRPLDMAKQKKGQNHKAIVEILQKELKERGIADESNNVEADVAKDSKKEFLIDANLISEIFLNKFAIEETDQNDQFLLKKSDANLNFSIAKSKKIPDERIQGIEDTKIKEFFITLNKKFNGSIIFDKKKNKNSNQPEIFFTVKPEAKIEEKDLTEIKKYVENFIRSRTATKKTEVNKTELKPQVSTNYLEQNKSNLLTLFQQNGFHDINFGSPKENAGAELIIHFQNIPQNQASGLIRILRDSPLNLICLEKTISNSPTYHVTGLKNLQMTDSIISELREKISKIQKPAQDNTQEVKIEKKTKDTFSPTAQETVKQNPNTFTQSKSADKIISPSARKQAEEGLSKIETILSKNGLAFKSHELKKKKITQDQSFGFVIKISGNENTVNHVLEIIREEFNQNNIANDLTKLYKDSEEKGKEKEEEKPSGTLHFNHADLERISNLGQFFQKLNDKISETFKKEFTPSQIETLKSIDKLKEELNTILAQDLENLTEENYFRARYLVCAIDESKYVNTVADFTELSRKLLDNASELRKILSETGLSEEDIEKELDSQSEEMEFPKPSKARKERNEVVHNGNKFWQSFVDDKTKLSELFDNEVELSEAQTAESRNKNAKYAKDLSEKLNGKIKNLKRLNISDFDNKQDLYGMVIDLADVFIKYKNFPNLNKLDEKQFQDLEKDEDFVKNTRFLIDLRTKILEEPRAEKGSDLGEKGDLRKVILSDLARLKDDNIITKLSVSLDRIIPKQQTSQPNMQKTAKESYEIE